MKNKVVRSILLALVLVLAPSFAFSLTLCWFLLPGGQSEAIDGEVGLRSYYYTGNGTNARPYEIVTPQHYYNLTRLQSLGIYPDKRCFQLGHFFTAEDFPDLDGFTPGFYCLDSTGHPTRYLDMSEFPSPLRPIGSEQTPFYGDFDGNDIVVKGLHVLDGLPEDIGMFGYIPYEGYVHNLILQDAEITSVGYNPDSSDYDNNLFAADVENFAAEVETAFNRPSYFASQVDLWLYNDLGVGATLKKYSGGTMLSNINASTDLAAANDSQLSPEDYTKNSKIYFKEFHPDDDPFDYSWHSSSYNHDEKRGLLNKEMRDVDNDGDLDEVMSIDLGLLKSSTQFNSGGLMEARTRISLVASVTDSTGNVFSRVVQSYTLEFLSNGSSWSEGRYSLKIYCDYIRDGGIEAQVPFYHHGNNIGFLAGHLDGDMEECYVYGGTFHFNGASNTPIATETDTGLIGEIGTNVVNIINPEIGLTNHGDTGVMNFTRIYSMIRSDFEEGDAAFAGHTTNSGGADKYFISYGVEGGSSSGDHLAEDVTFSRYKEYLRHDEGEPNVHYITSIDSNPNIPAGFGDDYEIPENYPGKYNSVDFLWNKIIADDKENDIDRGLGVFKLTTAKNDAAASGPYGAYWRDNLGDSRIVNGKTNHTKVYFSTAECDWTSGLTGWGTGGITPIKPSTLPTYPYDAEEGEPPIDPHSFDYPFSRDFNYCFELDLADEGRPEGQNYMFNTQSPFLTNYLYSVLVDMNNRPVAPLDSRFGFMFRSSLNEPVTSLSAYMPIGKLSSKSAYETSEGTKYYPSNAIVFHIDSAYANVSVVGNGNDIGIYSFDSTKPSGSVTEWYTMKSKTDDKKEDNLRYFEFDCASGETATSITTDIGNGMKDNNALYAHIFKLPRGDYAIGGSTRSAQGGTANLYFLAVQGQSDAELGATDIIAIGGDLKNVDFLVSDDGFSPFVAGDLEKAKFSFAATFDESTGDCEISNRIGTYINLSYEANAISIITYCRQDSPQYYFNDEVDPCRDVTASRTSSP